MNDLKDIQIEDLLNRIVFLTKEASSLRAEHQVLLLSFNKEVKEKSELEQQILLLKNEIESSEIKNDELETDDLEQV